MEALLDLVDLPEVSREETESTEQDASKGVASDATEVVGEQVGEGPLQVIAHVGGQPQGQGADDAPTHPDTMNASEQAD
jgi:hypothetical protein